MTRGKSGSDGRLPSENDGRTRFARVRVGIGAGASPSTRARAFAVAIAIAIGHVTALIATTAEAATSTCPSPAAIEAAVHTLLDRVDRDPDANRAEPVIEARDLGDRYSVSVAGRTRTYKDGARDCDARARAAAVFVALTLSPGSVAATESEANGSDGGPNVPADPISPTSRAAPPPAVPRDQTPPAWGALLELGALGAMAPRADTSQLVFGGELRFVAIAGSWGLSLGGSLPTSSTFDPSAVRVRQARYPIDVSIRRFWTGRWFRFALDAGALAAVSQLRQVSPANAEARTRVETGARMAATLATESPTLGLYLRAFSEFIPFPQQIAVVPRGIIGRTSALWIGATVGVALRFH